MDLVIVGGGRAGGALALASTTAGHRLVGLLTRRETDLGPPLSWDEPLPVCDLVLVAVTDDAIADVAQQLADIWHGDPVVAHLSGFVSVQALQPLTAVGARVGSMHPLQTLPDPASGARALAGAWAAITTEHQLASEVLTAFARSLGMRPFELADEAKPTYHAAAAAAANYVVESLAVASDLLSSADVPFEVVEPLVRAIVDNVFATGPDAALTGPIARGDAATVAGQLAAAAAVSPTVARQFRLLAEATAERVGMTL